MQTALTETATIRLSALGTAVGGAECGRYNRMFLTLSGLTGETVQLQLSTDKGVTFSAACGMVPVAGPGSGVITVTDPQNLGTGTGAATQFQVATTKGAVTSPGTINVYRVTWEGGARSNQCLQSQTFDSATWVKGAGLAVEADYAGAPDGTVTADRVFLVVSGSQTLYQAFIVSNSSVMTYSVYVKSLGTRATADFLLRSQTTSTNFDAGILTFATGLISGTGWTVETLPNGWFRCKYTRSTSITPGDLLVAYAGAFSNALVAGDSWLVWGAQIEAGSSATAYIPTVASAVTVYDVSKTLLYSTAKTNMILQSQTLGTTWTPTTASVGTNALAAPDGTTTAESLIEDATLGGHYLSQSVVTTAAAHTFSIYAKAWTRAAILVMNSTTGDGSYFNLATGALGDAELAPVSRSITSMGNGWYRCSITINCTAAANIFRVYLAAAATAGSFSYQGDNASLAYLWGAQLQTGSTATPYQVTVAGTSTITNYSINGTGLVTFASAPAAQTPLFWSGTYTGATVTTLMGNGSYMADPSARSGFLPACSNFRLVKSAGAETVTALVTLSQ